MTVGNKIKELRQAEGLSQKQLAEKMGVNNSLVSWWETGRCEPNFFSLILLADTFNISLDELACRDFKGESQNES